MRFLHFLGVEGLGQGLGCVHVHFLLMLVVSLSYGSTVATEAVLRGDVIYDG